MGGVHLKVSTVSWSSGRGGRSWGHAQWVFHLLLTPKGWVGWGGGVCALSRGFWGEWEESQWWWWVWVLSELAW